MSFESWLLFVVTVTIVGISPGPNVLIVIVHSLKYGWKLSMFTMLGNILCLFLVALLAAIGVGTLLHTQPFIYAMLKIAGAGYLIYMGINMILSSFKKTGNRDKSILDFNLEKSPTSGFSLASQAFFVSASNPKSVIFLTAFFPQFLDHTKSIEPQFVTMFFTIIALVMFIHTAYALLASSLRTKIVRPKIQKLVSRVTGGTFVGLGGGILVSE